MVKKDQYTCPDPKDLQWCYLGRLSCKRPLYKAATLYKPQPIELHEINRPQHHPGDKIWCPKELFNDCKKHVI